MNRNSFRIEAATLQLARDGSLLPFLVPPSDERSKVRLLLLAVFSSRIRWEVAGKIVDSVIASLDRLGPDAFYRQQPASLRILTAGHRYPQRATELLAKLLKNDGRAIREALSVADSGRPIQDARRQLISCVPGLGPKQSSLFLRTIGRGQQIAILDSHVVGFMNTVRLMSCPVPPATLQAYEVVESTFLRYADHRRVSADALDLAAWLVMRTQRGVIKS
jgi:thermostable 8-oxoguanine DNA glycosylase